MSFIPWSFQRGKIMKRKSLTSVVIALVLMAIASSCFNVAYPQASGGQYNIEQAISDKAQLNTLAFSGLGFLTGDLCSDSFLPPGKVADFFGFQYLRDTTQAGMGHSTDFVTNAANNVLSILSDAQKAQMIAVAKDQASLVNGFAFMRYPLMVAFRRQLDVNLLNGSSGLGKAAVVNYSSILFEIDGKITIQRAKLFVEIINSLTDSQRKYLDSMVTGGFSSWSPLPNQLDQSALTRDENVLVMTYASEMLGWYAGNMEADTYFCPERHADYFGGFYIKDAPAIGKAGYTIDETITGDKGEAFIAALDSAQKPLITSLIDTCRSAISGIVETRREIATELRTALVGGTINESRVLSLERRYGVLDGEISYNYAMAFAEVGKSLTEEQRITLMNLRGLNDYTCENGTIYLYSEKIVQPEIPDTDFLFNLNSQTMEKVLSSQSPTETPASTDPSSSITQRKMILDQNQIVICIMVLAAAFTAVAYKSKLTYKQKRNKQVTLEKS